MTPPDLPTLTLTPREVRQLAQLSPRGSFSCAPTGAGRPEQTAGYHRTERRTQLRGRLPALDRITDLVLAHRPAGGRFLLQRGALHLADQRRTIAILRLTPSGSARPTAA